MQVESRERTGYDYVSTSRLPPPEMVKSLVSEAYERFKSNAEGCSSDVYEALTRVPSDLFGVCVVGTSGNVYAVGDTDHPFSIMSVSKPFVFALVCQSTRGKQHRTTVQFAHRNRTQRRWANQPYGEWRGPSRQQVSCRAGASRPSGNLFTTACPALPGESCH